MKTICAILYTQALPADDGDDGQVQQERLPLPPLPSLYDAPAAEVLDTLRRFPFRPLDPGDTLLEAVHGWTDAADYMLDPAGIECGEYLRFGMRRDRRKVAIATLDMLYQRKVKEWQASESGVAGEQPPLEGSGAQAREINDPNPEPTRTVRRALKDEARAELLARAVPAHGQHDNGPWSVADPRVPELTDRLVAVIQSLDGTWHRPFTTLELAALQGLVDPEEHLELEGLSDASWRERIGNAVPPPAAQAIAGMMGEVLLLTWSGETFSMGNTPIWVRPAVAALMAARGEA